MTTKKTHKKTTKKATVISREETMPRLSVDAIMKEEAKMENMEDVGERVK